MRLCGLTKHSTQVIGGRYLGTVTLLVVVLDTPCCLPYCIQPQTVPTGRLGFEGLHSVASPPQDVPPTYFLQPVLFALLRDLRFRSGSRGPERTS